MLNFVRIDLLSTQWSAALKSLLRLLLVVASLITVTLVHAAEVKPYDQATFVALRAAGKPVLIHVYADWCPTCKQQTPVVDALLTTPEFRTYTVLLVNFDTQKDVRQALRAAQQSTLIVYRGQREVARSVGETNKDAIAATLRKATS
jgi:thioredoxin 1